MLSSSYRLLYQRDEQQAVKINCNMPGQLQAARMHASRKINQSLATAFAKIIDHANLSAAMVDDNDARKYGRGTKKGGIECV